MAWKRWYSNIEVEGSADIDLNQLIKEHKEDAIRLFTDEELQKELQLREEGKSKMEKYISSLDNSIDYLRVYVDEYDVLSEVNNSDLMSEVKQRGLNVVEFINASKYDLRKFICQTLDINELYTDEEILKMLKEIWKTQM
jgi:isoleucyl-tRNA synthetase